MTDRPKYVPDDQHKHLGAPPWKPGPELDAWEQAHGHDPRQKCIVEYGCMALANHYEWLQDEVDRLREALNQDEPNETVYTTWKDYAEAVATSHPEDDL